jgi:hypothetical protein
MTLTAHRTETEAPRASRSRRPGWRNPRLLLGLVLVAASIVVGARLMAAADDTVGVWVVARDLPAGAALVEEDVERRQIRFPDDETADRYLAATDDLPDSAALNRPVSAGELLPRTAIAAGSERDLVEVPISVASDDLPATVRQGSVVDIWVAPKVSAVSGQKIKAVPVLTDVVVVAVPRSSDGLAPQSTRQVIVGVPVERSDDLGSALGGIADGRVVVARKG